ncbi:MAG: hypothetical protein JWO03_1719 [Bacteroidetes bacterium]|nr:hypothetical protein [Bacteroidota bacterium]
MEKEIKLNKASGTNAERTSGKFITSLSYACFTFALVVLFHQGLLAFLSIKLGYETHISFLRVTSKPFDNMYWSNNRVLLLYAFPPGLLILSAGVFISRMFLYSVKKIDKWFVLSFWWSVNCLLYVSTQMTIALIAYSFGRDDLYQGIPVVINWFDVSMGMTFLFSLFTVIGNLLLGFLFYQLVMQFSPTRASVLSPTKQFATIRSYFLYPLILMVPLGAFLSFPNRPFFFLFFLVNGLLWLPGLFIKVRMGFGGEARIERNEIRNLKPAGIAAIIIFIILVRIIFVVV